MTIDPKQIARMITEDPNEVVPSDHFDDTEDEYMDEDDFSQEIEKLHVFGEIMANYLNRNMRTPADFTDGEVLQIDGGPDDAAWSDNNPMYLASQPGDRHTTQNFSYSHPNWAYWPRVSQIRGAVYFDNDGIWKYELDD